MVSEYLRTHLTNWPMRRFRLHEVHTFFQDIGASSRFFSRCLYAARPIFYTVGRLMVPITEISCCGGMSTSFGTVPKKKSLSVRLV